MQVGRLRTCGLAKESVLGTLQTPPTTFLRFIPPESFYPKVSPLISKAVGTVPDVNIKQTLGVGEVMGMKIPLELEPENIGQVLQACFGSDTAAESASFVIQTGVNDKINFKESGGSQLTGTIAAGTYIMGTTSATASTLCKAVKTAMDGAAGAIHTYTVTYSYTTKKVTIAASTGTVQILWSTGTNAATSARTILGFTAADTSDSASVTSNSTTTVPPFTHTFVRQAATQLPTYSWWFDKNPLYPQFVGCMLDKMDIDIKAKDIVKIDSDWTGLSYDATGITQTPSYSGARPFTFNMATVNVDGSPVLDYDNIKFGIKNMVKADHALSGSIFPAKIYSEGMDLDISADLFFEDSTQYNKFLAGTTAHLNVVLTSADDISGAATGTKYSLTIDVPQWVYQSANLVIPSGVLKIPFAGKGMLDYASTGYTVQMVLKNSVSTAY